MLGECPNCDWFVTGHHYHCHKCGLGFPNHVEMAKHAQIHIDRPAAERKRAETNKRKKKLGDMVYNVF